MIGAFWWILHQLNMGAGVAGEAPAPTSFIVVGRTAQGDNVDRTASGDRIGRAAAADNVRRQGGGRA